jgi:pimeloyl-ACP methyl ester carboxylesterase
MTRLSRLGLLAGLAAGFASCLHAAEFRSMRMSDGTEIAYALGLPEGFGGDKTYPALLAFPGGRQDKESVEGALSRFWEREAVKRGYIVFSPAAPPGKPFYESGADLIPEFLERQRAAFKIEGGKFHVAGSSNGGVSAFVVAIRHPELFHSLTVLAGFPIEQADFERLDRLRGVKISMFVGDGDLYWKEGMEKTRQRLASFGKPVYFEVVPRNGHFLPALSFENSARIFERSGR